MINKFNNKIFLKKSLRKQIKNRHTYKLKQITEYRETSRSHATIGTKTKLIFIPQYANSKL